MSFLSKSYLAHILILCSIHCTSSFLSFLLRIIVFFLLSSSCKFQLLLQLTGKIVSLNTIFLLRPIRNFYFCFTTFLLLFHTIHARKKIYFYTIQSTQPKEMTAESNPLRLRIGTSSGQGENKWRK